MAVLAGLVIYRLLLPPPVWELNARRFAGSFAVISGKTATIHKLSEFTPFEWDTLYSFAPYTPEETVYEVVGYRWDRIQATVNEGMNQVVFLKDGKVVCYIDGYPDEYKVYFSFGPYQGSHFKLTAADKLSFRMTVTKDGIRIFDYISG